MAFRVEHSKHQKVSISQILLQKGPSHESSHRWEWEKTEILETAAFLSWIFSTLSDITTIFIVSKNNNHSSLFYCYIIFTIFQTLSILCE